MRASPRRRRAVRYALVFLSVATIVGARAVLGAVDRDDSAPLARPTDKLAVAASPADEPGRSHTPGDCRDMNASFLDPACHRSTPRKRHSGRLIHRPASAVIGQTDARETDPRDAPLQRATAR
jgi:hypothetical protein